eukprot:SAG22_NODE_531_length_9422_cov_86.532983_5_plen_185_part_00
MEDADDNAATPLFFVAQGTNVRVARMLLRVGADPRRGNELDEQPAEVARGEMRQLLEDEMDKLNGKPALRPADWADSLWEWAVRPDAPPPDDNEAVLRYYGELLQYKKSYRDDGGSCTVDVPRQDSGGKTASMGACEAGNLAAVKLLVQSLGADVKRCDNSQKPVCVLPMLPWSPSKLTWPRIA